MSEGQRLMAVVLKQFNRTEEIWEHPDNFWLGDAIFTIIHASYGFVFSKGTCQK